MSLRERKTRDEWGNILGIKPMWNVLRRGGLRWMGHVLRKDKNNWARRVMEII